MIYTDHRSLIHLTEQRLHTPWQLKLYTKLAGLQYKIVYKPGSTNMAADALSRHPSPPLHLQAISSPTPTWLLDVMAGYSSDPFSHQLLSDLAINPEARPPYTLRDGILRLWDRIWIGSNQPLQQRLMAALHASAVGGHSGFQSHSAR